MTVLLSTAQLLLPVLNFTKTKNKKIRKQQQQNKQTAHPGTVQYKFLSAEDDSVESILIQECEILGESPGSVPFLSD